MRSWSAIPAVAFAIAIAGCSSTNGSESPAASATSVQITKFAFHEPRSPADAASEFARAHLIPNLARQNAAMDRLTCFEGPTYGTWPSVFTKSGLATNPRIIVTGSHRVAPMTWRVSVSIRYDQPEADVRLATKVAKQAGHYRVCTFRGD